MKQWLNSNSCLQQDKFGEAGRRIVVEEFLDGIELSVFVLTDGDHYVLLPEAKDYKKIGEGDKGPNTGGMGAVSPVPFADNEFMLKVKERIVDPTIQGLKADGIEYRGFIFIGLIKVGEEPMVIEYNCRLGDPETEVIIPRLKNDLVDLFQAVADKKLNEKTIEIDPRAAATMVAVSRGYPGSYEKGFAIQGLDEESRGQSDFSFRNPTGKRPSGHQWRQGALRYFLCGFVAGCHPQIDGGIDTY